MKSDQFVPFLKATFSMYGECVRNVAIGLRRNWRLIPASIAAFLAFQVAGIIAMMAGQIVGSFILGVASAYLIALYYGWLSATVDKERLRFGEMIQVDLELFFHVIGVGFVLWIVRLLVTQLFQGLDHGYGALFLNLGIVLLFNAIAEVIYLSRLDGVAALSKAAAFTRDNWFEWYLPALLLMIPGLLKGPTSVLIMLASSPPLLPATVATHILESSFSWSGFQLSGLAHSPLELAMIGGRAPDFFFKLLLLNLPAVIISVTLGNALMLFRAHLFKHLEEGTRRQRMFRFKQR